jgi:hypothetical protein
VVVFSKIQAVNLNQRFKIAIRNNATSVICMKKTIQTDGPLPLHLSLAGLSHLSLEKVLFLQENLSHPGNALFWSEKLSIFDRKALIFSEKSLPCWKCYSLAGLKCGFGHFSSRDLT